MTIYVGNITYSQTEEELRKLFEEYGNVSSIKIIKDKFSGRSKGYGFVEMEKEEQEEEAIKNLNRKVFSGRNLVVSKAHSKRGYPQKK